MVRAFENCSRSFSKVHVLYESQIYIYFVRFVIIYVALIRMSCQNVDIVHNPPSLFGHSPA